MQKLKQTGEPATVADARAVERFQKHETNRAEDVVGEVLWHQLLQPHFLRRTLVAEHADHVVAAEEHIVERRIAASAAIALRYQ